MTTMISMQYCVTHVPIQRHWFVDVQSKSLFQEMAVSYFSSFVVISSSVANTPVILDPTKSKYFPYMMFGN